MKITIAAAIAIVFAIVPAVTAFTEEKVIVRRAPACIEQKDVVNFYELAREHPNMAELAQFLQNHQCIALKSGDRVVIEQNDDLGLYYCVRVLQLDPCYWLQRSAFKR